MQHFDHSYKGALHTCKGSLFSDAFGAFSFQSKDVKITCKGTSFELVEEIGLSSTKRLEVAYNLVSFFFSFQIIILLF